VVPKFSDPEVVALSLTAENMGIDSKALLDGYHPIDVNDRC